MSDYIKREDAIQAFDPLQRQDWYTPWIVETLNDLPSADVVSVVRCGDCKYLMENGICNMFADDHIKPSASDFCSYGERKDDEIDRR